MTPAARIAVGAVRAAAAPDGRCQSATLAPRGLGITSLRKRTRDVSDVGSNLTLCPGMSDVRMKVRITGLTPI